MAHQKNVNQVQMEFPKSESQVEVTDPSCGKKMTRKESRHVLFMQGHEPTDEAEAVYFCSRECLDRYRTSKRAPMAA
jgi:YHS domain-containing protein